MTTCFGGDESEEFADIALFIVLVTGFALRVEWNFGKVARSAPVMEILRIIQEVKEQRFYHQQERVDYLEELMGMIMRAQVLDLEIVQDVGGTA